MFLNISDATVNWIVLSISFSDRFLVCFPITYLRVNKFFLQIDQFCYWGALLNFFFHFIHWIFQLQDLFHFFMISIFLLHFLFWSLVEFFLCIYFFKFGWVSLNRYFESLGSSYSPFLNLILWCHVSLIVLDPMIMHWCLCFWKIRDPFQSLWTDFEKSPSVVSLFRGSGQVAWCGRKAQDCYSSHRTGAQNQPRDTRASVPLESSRNPGPAVTCCCWGLSSTQGHWDEPGSVMNGRMGEKWGLHAQCDTVPPWKEENTITHNMHEHKCMVGKLTQVKMDK